MSVDKTQDVAWGPVGKDTYERTYSRVKADGTKETWQDTVARVVDGNLNLVDKKFWRRNERKDLIELFLRFGALPAGRHLWVSGIKGRQFLFNCHVSGWRKKMSDHYAFTFDELMKGGGVGANYSNRFINKYSKVKSPLDVHVVCDPQHPDYEDCRDLLSNEYDYRWDGCIPVEDSREGWVEALIKLVDSALDDVKVGDKSTLVFDVSRVREKGAPIRSFGGTASGPIALIRLLLGVADLLDSRVGEKLSSLDHMEIDHRIAACVIAGNVRRSARMSIKHWKDPDIFEFIKCKSDEAKVQHWTTNISVEVDNAFFRAYKKGNKHAIKVYKACVDAIVESGEPGFWNSSLSQHGETEEVVSTNPCGEIALLPFENCNLGHVNLGEFHDDPDGAKKAFMLMTRFLIRATFGDIYSPWQQEVVKKNRRIGVGFFGFQDWLCKQGKKYSECHNDPEIQSLLGQFYGVVKKTAMNYSHQLGIPAPIKNTTIAPTGTTAKLPGTSEGAQCIFAKYYEQRMRRSKNDPENQRLMDEGVEFEDCINKEEGENTIIAKYVCKHPLVDKVNELGWDADEIVEDQHEIPVEDTLAIQAMLQREWADNAISLTVNLPDEVDKEELHKTVIKYLPKLKGTTLITGAGGRPQPPYTPISSKEYDAYQGYKKIAEAEQGCSTGACPIK